MLISDTLNIPFYFVIIFLIHLNPAEEINLNKSSDSTHIYLSSTETYGATDIVTTNSFDSVTQNWMCHCWNSTNVSELECRCEGLSLLRVPQKLHNLTERLTIASAGIKILRTTGLKVYGNSLQDIEMIDFHTIEPGAFEHLPHLRTIYISHSPKLQHLSADSFRGISKHLKTLRIVYCGLINIPDLHQLSHNNILHMVDLEGNQIRRVDRKSIQLKTEEFILDSNALTYIDDSAFYGSEIAKLSLKNNPKLKELHESAFAGIVNIIELDLSSTSLEELPTEGLSTLEVLKIQNTHSLKTIPSVYNFKNLRFAWLTHSFHCCAFKFPSRHDPTGHEQRLKHLEYLQKECINKGYMAQQQQQQQQHIIQNGFHTNIRMKRWFRENKNSTNSIEILSNSTNLNNHEFDNQNFTQESSITGAPVFISVDDMSNINTDDIQEIGDLGEFLEVPAVVSPNNSFEAICGNLTQKYTIDVMCFPKPDALNPCEDVMGSNWLRGSVWIVVLLAVIGNVAVLIVLFSNRSDVTVPKFLMSNLATADFCMGLYLLLIASIDAHSIGEYFNVAYDWQYGSGCKAAGFLTVFASHLSIFTLTIITLERWFAITYAMYLNKRLKLKAAANIMIFGWMYSILMASLPLFGVSNYSSTSICLPMEARDGLDIWYLIFVLAVNGLAFFVILICYAQIYFSLGKETRQAARTASRGEMTVAKKMALLVFTNFACWAPIAFFGLTALAGYPLIDVAKSKILLVFFYPLNSCANPYLYAILTAQYRRDLFTLLSKYGFCTKRAQQYKMTYSLPTTHQSIPVQLMGRNNSLRNSRKERDEAFV